MFRHPLCALALRLVVLLPVQAAAATAPGSDPAFHVVLEESAKGAGFIQDRDGLFWLGMQDSLLKWYGGRPLSFSTANSGIGGMAIGGLLEATDGTIWIATRDGGLTGYDKDSGRFVRFGHDPENENSLSSDTLGVFGGDQSLAEDSAGALWVATPAGLDRLQPRSGEVRRYQHRSTDAHSLSSDAVTAVYVDAQRRLWVTTVDGVLHRYLSETDGFERHLIPMGPRPTDPLALAADGQGRLWIGTRGHGLFRFDSVEGRFESLADLAQGALASSTVSCLAFDAWGRLWMCHSPEPAGLSLFDPASGSLSNFRHDPLDELSLPDDTVRNVFVDRSGKLWLMTQAGRLAHLRWQRAFSRIGHDPTDPSSLNSNSIRPIYRDRDGTVWVGTKTEGGLHRYRPESGDFDRVFDPAMGSPYVLMDDSRRRFWIADVSGRLHRFDRASGRVVWTREIGSQIGALVEDANQPGVIWIGTYALGLFRFDAETDTLTNLAHDPADPESLSNNFVIHLHADQRGLWVSTRGGGLNWLALGSDRFVRYRHDPEDPQSLSNDSVNFVGPSAPGAYLVVTRSAIDQFDPHTGTFKRQFADAAVLPRSKVFVSGDELWGKRSQVGVVSLNPATGASRVYGRDWGVPETNFWVVGAQQMADGSIWMATDEGVVVARPQQVSNPTAPQGVVLTAINRSGRSLIGDVAPERAKQVRLEWNRSYFEFEYAALNFTDREQLRYRYRLEGVDSDWYEAGNQRQGRYAALPPGRYTLRVGASNLAGGWSEQAAEARLEVLVAAPFWGQLWFQALAATLLMALTMLALRAYVRYATYKQGARIDVLTGLYSRRQFEQTLAELGARARSLRGGVLVFDIDRFKQINDRHGHNLGDQALRAVGELLREQLRGDAQVFRFGGDELLALLPSADRDTLRATAQRLLQSVRGLRLGAGAERISMTLSIGGALLAEHDGASAAIDAADQALLAAKQAGRDRFEMAGAR